MDPYHPPHLTMCFVYIYIYMYIYIYIYRCPSQTRYPTPVGRVVATHPPQGSRLNHDEEEADEPLPDILHPPYLTMYIEVGGNLTYTFKIYTLF